MAVRDSIQATIDAWDCLERLFVELGFTGPPVKGLGDKSRAEELSKTAIARLANLDPPVLVCYGHELREEER